MRSEHCIGQGKPITWSHVLLKGNNSISAAFYFVVINGSVYIRQPRNSSRVHFVIWLYFFRSTALLFRATWLKRPTGMGHAIVALHHPCWKPKREKFDFLVKFLGLTRPRTDHRPTSPDPDALSTELSWPVDLKRSPDFIITSPSGEFFSVIFFLWLLLGSVKEVKCYTDLYVYDSFLSVVVYPGNVSSLFQSCP